MYTSVYIYLILFNGRGNMKASARFSYYIFTDWETIRTLYIVSAVVAHNMIHDRKYFADVKLLIYDSV